MKLFALAYSTSSIASACVVFSVMLPAAAGAQSWEDAIAKYEAAGYSLDYDSFVPKPVPDEENFAAIPALRGVTIPEGVDHPSGIDGGAVRDALKYGPLDGRGAPKIEFGTPTDLHDWADRFGKDGAEAKDPAAVVLAALDSRFGALFAQADGASSRQHSRFVPPASDFFDRKNPLNSAIAHGQTVLSLSRAFALRAVAASRVGDNEIAAGSIRALLQLQSAASPPTGTLIETLFVVKQFESTSVALHEILATRSIDAATLADFQNRLDVIDFTSQLHRSFELEALMFPYIHDQLKGAKGPVPGFPIDGIKEEDITELWIDRATAIALDKSRETFLEPMKTDDFRELKRQASALDAWIETAKITPVEEFHHLVALTLPAVGTVGRRVARAEARVRQIQLACALERYFLKHASYPGELESLVPDFMEVIPEDPIDRKPMRYRRPPGDGRYVLYSIGWDETDDDASTDAVDRDRDSKDWVWSYAAR